MLAINLLIIASLAAAQSILPSTPDASFPACGLTCQNVVNAQNLCVPPIAPVTNQYYYDQCFCQSALLTTLYSTPEGLCDAECTADSDRQLLQTWYKTFCAQVAQTIVPTVAGALSTTDASSTVVVTVNPTITSSDTVPTTMLTSPSSQSVLVVTVTSTNSVPVVTASSVPTSGSSSDTGSSSGGLWIDNHWQWILMLGILIVGFILLAWLAVWLKRRYRRKHESRQAMASGLPPMREQKNGRSSTATLEEMFGPHQHMHMTKGWQYTQDQHKALGAGVLGAARKKSRERKHEKGRKGEAGELGGNRVTKRDVSRDRQTSKGGEGEGTRGRDKRKPTKLTRTFSNKDIERDVDAIEKG